MVLKARRLGKMAKGVSVQDREENQRPQGVHSRGRGGGGGTSECDRRDTRSAGHPGRRRKKVSEWEGGMRGQRCQPAGCRWRQRGLPGFV